MLKYLMTIILVFLLASYSWSQEPPEPEEPADTEVEEAEVAEREDDEELDEPGYGKEDDDDFVPSQEVTADQSLPFPTDI
jgi:hypothetical protein